MSYGLPLWARHVEALVVLDSLGSINAQHMAVQALADSVLAVQSGTAASR